MSDTSKLPYLIRLLDDESDTVRTTVRTELESIGLELEDYLAGRKVALTADQKRLLQPIIEKNRRSWLRRNWSSWSEKENEMEQLETAMQFIATFQEGKERSRRLSVLLDGLSEMYRESHRRADSRLLAQFLFNTVGLSGAQQEDYYDAMNSNLVYVIEHKRGIPISLASVYMLVGHRLGLDIRGCNFPGHFFALAPLRNQKILVDCYHGGKFLNERDIESIGTTITFEDILRLECDAEAMIARTLRNLIGSYKQSGETERVQLMSELLLMAGE